MIISIIETLKLAYGTYDDFELYKKTLSKIVRLFEHGINNTTENVFTRILLRNPSSYETNDAYVLSRLDYINELIITSPQLVREHHQKEHDHIIQLETEGLGPNT